MSRPCTWNCGSTSEGVVDLDQYAAADRIHCARSTTAGTVQRKRRTEASTLSCPARHGLDWTPTTLLRASRACYRLGVASCAWIFSCFRTHGTQRAASGRARSLSHGMALPQSRQIPYVPDL